ncbi:Rpn family recombination-promoting nuclease/putative transposase [Candidatus Tisiphia endosymbiont of Micropterix aruncella]|uniref:Rpn family recombination-promoting nuclease/putative transposase n=1 Tax=Candidatus Tisiphia endosymbiont of Micropterix aruncella TaxID=3066271 RepID=UPI003AA7AB57
MSVNFIHDFHMTIYKLLSSDQDIRLSVDRIYISVVQDAKYPFLLINILKVENISRLDQNIYEVEFEISAFARDKNQGLLTLVAEKITNKLTANACILQDYIVASMKACNINFQRSSDLITTKLTIDYKALLKEKGVINMEKYLDPTNDSLFKKIFRDKENLKEFLNSVLDLSEMYRIKEIEFIPVEELAGIHKGRRSVFDLKVKDESGNWYIIEMQKKNETDYLKRVQYYPAHSYVGQLIEGLTHLDLLPVIVISLVKTRIFDKEVPYISIHKNVETTTNKQYLFDLSYIFIELGKFKKTQLTSVADEWLHLFKCATQETEPPKDIKSSKVLDAYHMIERYKLTPAEYDLYIRTKLQEDAENIALSEHFTKGKAEEKIAMAKEMLANNEPIEKIVKYTKLSIEEIEQLKK